MANRHPEIAAVEAIYEALIRLPDEATRERVLTYARHLIETAGGSNTPLRLIDDRESAD